MQSLLPVILHLSTGDLAQAFVDRLWYHARQITLEMWDKDLKRIIQKHRKVGKIPEEFVRQGKEHAYKAFSGNHSYSIADVHKAIVNASAELWFNAANSDFESDEAAKYL